MLVNIYNDRNTKSRYFTFKVYQENLIKLGLSLDDLKTDLLSCGGGFISPLHNMDNCKEHYHIISISENARNCFFLHGLIDKYNSEKFIGKVNSSSKDTFLLYLTHENDNNEKFVYDRNDVICVGVDYDSFLSDTVELTCMGLSDILHIIQTHRIYRLIDLLNYCLANGMIQAIRYIHTNCYLVTQIIREMNSYENL